MDVEADAHCRETSLLAIQVLVVRSFRREGSAEERAARERDTREGIDGRRLACLVATLLRRSRLVDFWGGRAAPRQQGYIRERATVRTVSENALSPPPTA
jgi:hypothetical protein